MASNCCFKCRSNFYLSVTPCLLKHFFIQGYTFFQGNMDSGVISVQREISTYSLMTTLWFRFRFTDLTRKKKQLNLIMHSNIQLLNYKFNAIKIKYLKFAYTIDILEVKWSEVAQLCPTLCDPMDCSLSGSSSMEFSRQEY